MSSSMMLSEVIASIDPFYRLVLQSTGQATTVSASSECSFTQ